MKIESKLLMVFAAIIFIMIASSFLIIQLSKKSLRESIALSQVLQAQQIMENIDREIYYRIEEILSYREDVLLQEALHQSNHAMAEMADREAWIRQQDRDWIAAPDGTITPFMDKLMGTPLAKELREKKEFYTQDWLQQPIYPELFVTNRYGAIIATTGRTSDYMQADEEWYQRAVAQKTFWISEMEYDESARLYSCDIIAKLYDEDHEFAGTLKAVMNIETIQAILKKVIEQHERLMGDEYHGHIDLKLLTKDGRLIFASESGYEINENVSGHDIVKNIAQDPDRVFFTLPNNVPGDTPEDEELVTYARSSGYRDYKGQGWLMIVEHGSKGIFAPVNSFARFMWTVVAVIAGVTSMFAFFFSQSFVRLVQRLRATTNQLQEKIVEHQQSEETLQKRTHDLNKRVKELNCLFAISTIIEKSETSLGDMLKQITEVIPPSWQYPDIACAQIKLDDGNTYKTDNFKESEWLLSQPIIISGKKAGAVEVYYLEEKPEIAEGPFHEEERFLINDIAERIGTIIEEKQAGEEKSKLQSFVYQQEKMASIGQLAAGVAHEINNPIGFISSNLGTLDKYMSKYADFIKSTSGDLVNEELQELRKKLKIDFITEDTNDLIRESQEGIERVKEIVQNLKSFSRVDEVEQKEEDINECLERTIKVIWNELKYKAKVIKEYGKLPFITCHPQQLSQVFMNLLVNAAQAIDKMGEIRIKTWQENNNVFVSISDTGSGISAENLSKLFEPFFTTKETGKGTGLGLSIAYEIIQKHDGEIDVESEVGKGTTFTIKLPVA